MDFTRLCANVPQELQAGIRWLLWRYELRKGKQTKVPYSAWSFDLASSTNPATWAPIERVLGILMSKNEFDGAGRVLVSEDKLVGIDLDHCLDPASGLLTDFATDIITRLQTYTEVSPSGTGVHLLCHGTLLGPRRQSKPVGAQRDIELYPDGRFLCMTGDILTPYGVEERTAELATLYAELFPTPPEPPQPRLGSASPLSDDTVLRTAAHMSRGKFFALWQGDTTAYADNESRADAALCAILARVTDDPAQIDRLFRMSALCRRKWDSPRPGDGTYGARTINHALAFVGMRT